MRMYVYHVRVRAHHPRLLHRQPRHHPDMYPCSVRIQYAYVRIFCAHTDTGTNSRYTYTVGFGFFVLITLAFYTANLATILVRIYVYSVAVYVHNVYYVPVYVHNVYATVGFGFLLLITLASYTANLATILVRIFCT